MPKKLTPEEFAQLPKPERLRILAARRCAARAREYRINNPEKVRAAKKEWRKNNPEKVAKQREAARKSTEKWRKANPGKLRDREERRQLKRRGLTISQFKEMVAAQDGKCAVCRKVPRGKRRLHVDHCHKTGMVRGLLCHHCNMAIGLLEDSPRRLRSAIRYLEQLPLL
jgi:hypothetical protein